MSRNYSSTAPATSLTQPIAAVDTTIYIRSVTGLPAVPFTMIIDPDTVSMEIVTVTAVVAVGSSAQSFTVTRGEDGTGAVDHTVGAVVLHGVSARDYTDLQTFIVSETGAWTPWTPVFASGAPTLNTVDSAYHVTGKTMRIRFYAKVTTAGSGSYSLVVPGGYTLQSTHIRYNGSLNGTPLIGSEIDTTHLKWVKADGTQLGASDVTVGDTLALDGTLELA